MKFFKKAAIKGHVDSMYQYAIMFDFGFGVPINKKKAIKFFAYLSSKFLIGITDIL